MRAHRVTVTDFELCGIVGFRDVKLWVDVKNTAQVPTHLSLDPIIVHDGPAAKIQWRGSIEFHTADPAVQLRIRLMALESDDMNGPVVMSLCPFYIFESSPLHSRCGARRRRRRADIPTQYTCTTWRVCWRRTRRGSYRLPQHAPSEHHRRHLERHRCAARGRVHDDGSYRRRVGSRARRRSPSPNFPATRGSLPSDPYAQRQLPTAPTTQVHRARSTSYAHLRHSVCATSSVTRHRNGQFRYPGLRPREHALHAPP